MEENLTVKILLVDDHPLVLEGLKGLLMHENAIEIVATAYNGKQALEFIKAAHTPIDLVVSDIDMPEMNGIELCKELKKLNHPPQVLVLSVHTSSTMVKGAIAAEADGYMLKNASKEDIIYAIQRVANGSCFYSQEIIPIIYAQYQKEKKTDEQLATLTPREKEILSLIMKELTSNEIAEKLFISRKTVEVHRANLLEKTASKSTIGLVKYALKLGID
jgi:DNA-binding NarL/FixJ family response regulator